MILKIFGCIKVVSFFECFYTRACSWHLFIPIVKHKMNFKMIYLPLYSITKHASLSFILGHMSDTNAAILGILRHYFKLSLKNNKAVLKTGAVRR